MNRGKNWLAFAAHMLPLPLGATPEERELHSRQMLLRAFNLKTTVAVVGSGCSIPLKYPSWADFTRQVLDRTIRALGIRHPDVRILIDYRDSLKPGKSSQGQETSMMLYIGACRDVLERNGKIVVYKEYIQNTFGRAEKNLKKSYLNNPYFDLVDLPVRRFVTTNYDCEIESTLWRRGRLGAGDFSLNAVDKGRRLSFSQKNEYFEELALFALGEWHDNAPAVFHCHGRFDEIDSIIASESDYQQWYIKEGDGAATAFRQCVQLLFSSNPLLFVGYGLGDDDLLRPLRYLGAIDPMRKRSRVSCDTGS